jgi:hypothetical protein
VNPFLFAGFMNQLSPSPRLRFGPSLPHDSVLAVLEFYGMSESWLGFFEKWLNANLLFEGASGPRTRSRGVPIAHALSVSRYPYSFFT